MHPIREAAGPLEASIFVEGLRSIPAGFLALALLAHALIWSLAMQLAEPAPPPQMAVAIALGREWMQGYTELPPLAAWLSAAIYCATSSLFLLRLASTLCVALAGWLVFLAVRRIAGDRHAAIAVMLMVGAFPVALPGNPLVGDVLQMPLAAAAVIAWWIAVGERKPNGWIALAIILGAMFYAGPQGLVLAVLFALVSLLSAHGRGAVSRFDALLCIALAFFIFAFVAGPRLLWLWQNGAENLFAGLTAGIGADELHPPLRLIFDLLLGHFGFAMILFLATAYAAKENAPVFVREQVTAFSRAGVVALAIVPALLALLWLYTTGRTAKPHFFAPLLLFSGAAAVLLGSARLVIRRQRIVGLIALIFLFVPPLAQIASSFSPGWLGDNRAANWPALSAARTLTEIFHTRTGRPLEYLVGARVTATQISVMSADRPHVVIDADLSRSPWIDGEDFAKKGGIVFWEIRGADQSPPADYVAKLPAFVAEAPLRLPWARGGGDPVRLGWAIIPPR